MKAYRTSIIGLFYVAMLAAPLARGQSTSSPPAQQSSTSTASTAASTVTNPSASAQTPAVGTASATTAQSSKYIQVPTGTKLPLVLHNAVSTRTAHAGDSVYLETLFPIMVGERIAIPAGSYVSGEVTEAKRGNGHGAEIAIKLNNLILPNGYQAQFDAVPSDAGTGGKETVDKEGKIQADKNRAGDAKTVVEGTAVGAGVGGIVTRTATGAGVGAGLGAVAGLITAHLNKPDVELPRGTTLDVVLDQPLYLLSAKINFTSPGQASTLAGPSVRQSPSGIIPH